MRQSTYDSLVKWRKDDSAVITEDQRERLRNIRTEIKAFLARQDQVNHPVLGVLLKHFSNDVEVCFEKAFSGAFFGDISAATVGNVFQLRKKIALGKDGISYQLGKKFSGDNALGAPQMQALQEAYNSFADTLQEEIAPTPEQYKKKGIGRG